MAKKRMGRPPKPAEEKRDAGFVLRLTRSEREKLDAAAGAEPVTVWARAILLRAGRRRK